MANDIPVSSVYYDGDGTTTSFGVPFEYIDAAYVFVEVDGVSVPFTWTTSDTVTLATAPATGTDNVHVYRSTISTSMLAVFSEDSPFLAKYVDKDNTQLLHLIQEVGGAGEDRDAAQDATSDDRWAHTLRTPDVVEAIPFDAATRANKTLGFNAAGNPTVITPVSGSAADVLTLLASTTGAGLIGYDVDTTYPEGTLGAEAASQFKTCQNVQYYYDRLGNWDDAIFAAQLAVYLKGFSPHLRFPTGPINITRPILGGSALGDYIHAKYPDLEFYNASTGAYKATWPTILEGVPRKWTEGSTDVYRGTQIVFNAPVVSDQSFAGYGIIHMGPTELEQVRRTATVKKAWGGHHYIRNLNIMAVSGGNDAGYPANVTAPSIHGIYSFGAHQSTIENCTIYNVWGGGIVYDWVFDSRIEHCLIMRTGRMSYRDYASKGFTTASHQAYAPIHVLYSPTGSDNSNFIKIIGVHFEDNYHGADIILSGNTSPVWIDSGHHEVASAANTSSAASTKVALASGGFGVAYFLADLQSDYTPDSPAVPNKSAALYWNNGSMYPARYQYMLDMNLYGTAVLTNFLIPNPEASGIRVRTNNSAAAVRATNCRLGDITFTGGNSSTAPLDLTACTAGAIYTRFTHSPRMIQVNATSLTRVDSYATVSNPVILDNCVFQYVALGTVGAHNNYYMGNIWLTSTTVQSNYRVGGGALNIVYNAYGS